MLHNPTLTSFLRQGMFLFLFGLIFTFSALAESVSHWRFDDADAAIEAPVTATENSISPGSLDAEMLGGNPLYSNDVPSTEIYDPVAGTIIKNEFSLNATDPNSKMRVADSDQLNTNFTVEFFIKIIGEPTGWQSFLRRQEGADFRWQVDFDRSAGLSYGRTRSRWDTPAGGISDNKAEKDIDENTNFVVGPLGGLSAAKIFTDTGAKDELDVEVGPQNTGNASDYIYDAASANTNDTRVQFQGDSINDNVRWHHVALTFDQESGEVSFFFDYSLSQRNVLADTEDNGYTHPSAPLDFGKLANADYGLLLDEIRYSNTILSPDKFLRAADQENNSDTIAYWRMEDPNAKDGGIISFVSNTVSPLHAALRRMGSPIYSVDVPAPFIYDPVAGTYSANAFSFSAKNSNARIGAGNEPAFDTSFTVEMFFKLVEEPPGYNHFIRRRQVNDLTWQIDFDHNKKGAFGRIRSRWDTPAGGVPDNVAEKGVDENTNFVVGATGGANVSEKNRIWIDTDAGDGLVSSYDDAEDWFLDGDGVNDATGWKHVALTFDEESQDITIYFDYELMQSKQLADTEENGYTHPAGNIEFGKFNVNEYEMFFDEVRYSGSLLDPSEFLKAVTWAPEPFEITTFDYNQELSTFTLEWRSEPGILYSVDRWDESINQWGELEDALISATSLLSFEDTSLEPTQKRAIYRVRLSNP